MALLGSGEEEVMDVWPWALGLTVAVMCLMACLEKVAPTIAMGVMVLGLILIRACDKIVAAIGAQP